MIESCGQLTFCGIAIRISEEHPEHLPPAEVHSDEWLPLEYPHPFAPCAADKVHSSAWLSTAGNVPASASVLWFPFRSAEIGRRMCAGDL